MNFKVPLVVNILFGVIAASLLSYNVFYRIYKEGKNKENFFRNHISSKISSFKSYEGRTMEFHLEEGCNLYFLPSVNNKIIVGDSIQKEKNTFQYKVYRKDENGIYKYFTTYDFEHIQ